MLCNMLVEYFCLLRDKSCLKSSSCPNIQPAEAILRQGPSESSVNYSTNVANDTNGLTSERIQTKGRLQGGSWSLLGKKGVIRMLRATY